MFIDLANISVKAGNGGNGVVSWRREIFEPSGGPYGGDGGNGGSIIIKADENIRTLLDFRYKKNYKGNNGEDGRTKRQYGAKGEDIVLRVPVGTLVKDADSLGVIVDLKSNGESFVIAKGGKGGRGNAKFATSTRQAPGFAEAGTKGEEKSITLELKMLADVSLVGYPNVGKSTIISIISAAKPKIANYHFTTLTPNLGVVYIASEKSFVIADIPGLIDGASEGIGLGHDFLRHIERTRVIAHVIDGSGSEGRNPIDDYYNINNELLKYNPEFANKPQIIIINKTDLSSFEEWEDKIKEEFKDKKLIFVSGATTTGIEELKFLLWNELENTEKEYLTFDEEFTPEEYKPNEISVNKVNGQYLVEGDYIERLLESTYFDDRDSLRFFQERLRKLGIVDKLVELGIQEGEMVSICGYEFEFSF